MGQQKVGVWDVGKGFDTEVIEAVRTIVNKCEKMSTREKGKLQGHSLLVF